MSFPIHHATEVAPEVQAGPGTLGATIWLAIAEQVRRFRRYRRRVLTAKDAEDLHQLRVSLRRLRAALAIGREAVDLPAAGDPASLIRLGKALGRLRDLDVAIAAIEPLVVVAKGDEAVLLGTVRSELRRMRRMTRRTIRRALASDQVDRTTRAMRKWVRDPRFCPFAFRPLTAAATALLLPAETRVRHHPGWAIRTPAGRFSAAQDEILHDLRKRAKDLRYRVEILTRPDPAAAAPVLATLRQLQDVLGAVHDVATARHLVDRAGTQAGIEPPALISGRLDQSAASATAAWNGLQPEGYRGMVTMALGVE
jgi:CHAD domain-containing protein